MTENTAPGLSSILAGHTHTAHGDLFPIPDNWRQGRTTYGGITAGLSLASALKMAERDHDLPDGLPPLRSATINFIGPVTQDPICKPRLLRRGRNVTSAFVELVADDTVVANSTLFFGNARPSSVAETIPAPDAPSPDECELFTPSATRDLVPVFFHNFDTRLIAGGRPLAGIQEAYIRTWSRHHDPQARTGITAFLTLADVLPPAALAKSKIFAPISTVNWLITMINEPHTDDGWYQIEIRQSAAAGGYSSQHMRFWNTQGTLIAEALQSVAVFF